MREDYIRKMENYSNMLDDTEIVMQSSAAAVIGTLLFIIGLPANILLIVTCIRLKRLRVSHNVFTVNLAVCDTMIIGILLPITFVTSATGSYPLSPEACMFAAVLSHLCFTGSVITLMSIAINRYIKICHGKYYNKIFNKKTLCMFCISIWSAGLLFAIPLLTLEDGFFLDVTLQMCIFNRFKYKAYAVIYMVLCLMVPISLTILCYMLIYRYYIQSKKRLYRNWNNGLVQTRLKHEDAICRAHFAVFTSYFVLLMPFGLVAMFEKADDVPKSVHLLVIYLCYTNSCVNTFVYGVFNSNIRKAYKELIPCLGCKRHYNNSSTDIFPLRSQGMNHTSRVFPVTGSSTSSQECRNSSRDPNIRF